MAKEPKTKTKRVKHGGAVARPDAKIAEALMSCGGRVTDAARRLGMDRSGIYARIAASEELKRALEVAREELIDEAETSLRALIQAGDPQAVIFALRTLGKKRGYVINEPAPTVTVNNNTAVVASGFGENPERQAKLLEMRDRLRAIETAKAAPAAN